MIYDYIVVGAGPAGSTAAYELSKKENNVLILDESNFPRRVRCGHMVPKTVEKLIGFEIPEDMVRTKITKTLLTWETLSEKNNWNKDLIKVIKRYDFDNLLLEKAKDSGAEFKVDTINSYEKNKDIITVKSSVSEYKAKNLIIATGSVGALKKQALGNIKDENTTAFTSATAFNPDGYLEKDTFHLDVDLEKKLLFWVVPEGRGFYTLGIGNYSNKKIDLKKATQAKALELGYEITETIKGRVQELTNPKDLPIPKEKNIYLIGDAYNTVSPFSGEGIYQAILSAKILAEDPDKYYKNIKSNLGFLLKTDFYLRSLFTSKYPFQRTLCWIAVKSHSIKKLSIFDVLSKIRVERKRR